MKKSVRKAVGLLLALIISVINFSVPVQNIKNLPQTIYYNDKSEINLLCSEIYGKVLSPKSVTTVSTTGDERLYDKVEVYLFGIIPVKTVKAIQKESIVLVPSGHNVGIVIETRGLLVADTSNVITDANGTTVNSPAESAGVRSGDIITHVNGKEVNTTKELLSLCTESTVLTVQREGESFNVTLHPVLDKRTDELRLGMWVREDTAGVGTLSYYSPDDMSFAALGHAVTDVDTGTASDIKSGSLCSCRVVSIERGKAGTPGELIGVFSEESDSSGTLTKNTEFGVFGENLKTSKMIFLYSNGLPMAYPDEVHTGKASILCQLKDSSPKEYECEIIKCCEQNAPAVKGLIVEIKDSRLIDITGGIVQGMSGSPILQDGKIVGVVTHVMINNPLRGYGIYACWMNMTKNK